MPRDLVPQITVDGDSIVVLMYEERGLPRLRRMARELGISDTALRIIRPVVFLQPHLGDDLANDAAYDEFIAAGVRMNAEGAGVQLSSMDPVAGSNSRVLILGSMPGELSLQAGQYYANGQNRFWRVMQAILGVSESGSYEQRTAELTLAGVALWDVLKHCRRVGSLDSKILSHTEVPNDLHGFLQLHPTINRIVFNGQKAARSFRQLVEQGLPDDLQGRVVTVVAPSTSGANARATLDTLIKAWNEALSVTA
jgi:hypoxanthine-DNA glycosylase